MIASLDEIVIPLNEEDEVVVVVEEDMKDVEDVVCWRLEVICSAEAEASSDAACFDMVVVSGIDAAAPSRLLS